ncbi:MAG TPA: pullulanase-type alpha-1,6-glucosidase [Thermoanaerobaculia bacterium]|nr:pullulanase-type alpha-1,6-glucosidase [Thermoanaerobaculia bacterium]
MTFSYSRELLRAPGRAIVLLAFAAGLAQPAPSSASDTPDPTSVTVAGSLQDELGCSGDWQPDCAATHLVFDADDRVWQGVFAVPAGSFEYKAPLNDSWDENYGLGAVRNGPNIPLNLGVAESVKFYYDHESHWITDNVGSTIAVAPGSFQSELGCPGDWDPSCLRSWLQDPDGDGTYTFTTFALPAGSYEAKVAIDESWAENYGAGGVPNGANIPFTVAADCTPTVFSWDSVTKVLTISAGGAPAQPASVTIPGSFQSELGCSGDWLADCANTHLAYDTEDTVWQGVFSLPAGSWEYKAALNDSWDVNYGANATQNGPNIGLTLAAPEDVKFYYDHGTHWVISDGNARIVTAAGDFQSELGCSGDWQPGCLRSWLQDPDGDGVYTAVRRLPAGNFETKAALFEGWDENYGQGGVPGGPNIAFSVPQACAEVFFSFDSASNVLTVSAAGAPAGNLNRAQAYWVLEDTIAWNVPVVAGNSYRLHWDQEGDLSLDETGVVGGQSIALTHDPGGLPQAVADKFPHLANLPAFKIGAADLSLVPAILKSRFAVSAATAGGDPVDATSLQIPGVLDDLYAYTGPLGVTWSDHLPTLRLWAPTARAVALLLYADAEPATAPTSIPMSLDAGTGVWSVTGTPSWKGQYYLYEVEVWAPSTAAVEVNQVTDPYSLSLSADSQRSQIVDLDDPALKPVGWDRLRKPRLERPEDVVLYELHVRDFSIADESVPPARRGTFRAFAEPHSDGMRHLAALARAGLTHVHLLPAFDFATVPERREDQLTTSDLSGYPPDSDQQQAAVASIRDQDGFNWGYDPFHYTVPEGSYATDPDGSARIRQFREMVRGLSRAGLRTVMDVVYNHTTASGQNAKSVLDRIVPGYYHRLNADGFVETSTCCANTASEHAMMGKLMRDSLLTWAKAYKVDGFRFDLMGHHMKANLLEIRDALAALTLEDDGVDGSKIYLYGEGWNFGEVANNARGVNATQLNMGGTGIGTFSDRLRDAARGGNPFGGLPEQGFINGLYTDSNGQPQGNELDKILLFTDQIKVGLAGNLAAFPLIDRFGNAVVGSQIDYNGQPAGYTQDPQEVITYVEAHDNETLFDAIQLKAPAGTPMSERVRMHNLGVSLVALGQGIPFFHAGVDLLRSKSLDRNSYNSGDWFNAIDWTGADNGWGHGLPAAGDNQSNWPLFQPLLANPALKSTVAEVEKAKRHLREMLEIRKSSELFRLESGAEVIARVRFHNQGPGQVPGLLVMSIGDPEGDVDRQVAEIVVIVNVDDQTLGFAPAGLAESRFELHPVQRYSFDSVVRTASYDPATGIFTVPGRTAAVFVAKRRGGPHSPTLSTAPKV